MVKYHLPVKDVYRSVRRAVVRNAVIDLAAHMGVKSTINIRYPEGDDREDISMSMFNEQEVDSFGHTMDVLISSSIRTVDHTFATTPMRMTENPPVFRDDDLFVYVSPAYNRVEVELNVEFVFQDKNEALTQMTRVRHMMYRDNRALMHELKYHYLLPEEVSLLLKEIYTLREAQAGYGESIDTYYDNKFDARVFQAASPDGVNVNLAVSELQNRVFGSFDFTLEPDEPEKKDNNVQNSIRFTYRFNYDEVQSMYLQYPILIHNQLLNPTFYNAINPYNLATRPSEPGFTNEVMDSFVNNPKLSENFKGIGVPMVDTWTPLVNPKKAVGLARVLAPVDPDALTYVLNLEDLGDVKLADEVIAYMKDNYSKLTILNSLPLYVCLYDGDHLVDEVDIYVDNQLNVWTHDPRYLRKLYHLWIAVNTNIFALPMEVKKNLASHGHFAQSYLLFVEPAIAEPIERPIDNRSQRIITTRSIAAPPTLSLMPEVNRNGRMSELHLLRAIEAINANTLSRNKTPYQKHNIGLFIELMGE